MKTTVGNGMPLFLSKLDTVNLVRQKQACLLLTDILISFSMVKCLKVCLFAILAIIENALILAICGLELQNKILKTWLQKVDGLE